MTPVTIGPRWPGLDYQRTVSLIFVSTSNFGSTGESQNATSAITQDACCELACLQLPTPQWGTAFPLSPPLPAFESLPDAGDSCWLPSARAGSQ